MATFAAQYRGVEQLVARRAHNPEVVGSSPASATKKEVNQTVSLFFCTPLAGGKYTISI